MKAWILALVVVAAPLPSGAQQSEWQPSAGHKQIPIWSGAVPDARTYTGPETMKIDDKDLVAGKPWTYINNVSQPTMTVYSPQGRNDGKRNYVRAAEVSGARRAQASEVGCLPSLAGGARGRTAYSRTGALSCR